MAEMTRRDALRMVACFGAPLVLPRFGQAEDGLKIYEGVRALEDVKEAVNAIALSDDGSRVAGRDDHWTMRIWDASTGTPIRSAEKLSCYPTALALNNDGSQAAMSGWSKFQTIFEPSSKEQHGFIDGKMHSVPIGYLFKIRDTRTGRVISTFFENKNDDRVGFKAISFNKEGSLVSTIDAEDVFTVWDAQTGKPFSTIDTARFDHAKNDSYSELVAAFDDSGMRAVAVDRGSYGRRVKAWDAFKARSRAYELLHVQDVGFIDLTKGSIWHLALSPDGKRFATSTGVPAPRADERPYYRLSLWDFDTGTRIWLGAPRTEGGPTAMIFSPDGRYIATGGGDGVVCLWDAANGHLLQMLNTPKTFMVRRLVFIPGGIRGVSGGVHRVTDERDPKTGQRKLEFEPLIVWDLKLNLS